MIEIPETSPGCLTTSQPVRRSTSTLRPSSLTLSLTTPAWKHPEARARPTWSCLCSLLSTCKHTPACMCAQPCLTLSVTPWTVACQAPLSVGFPRQEYWRGLPLLSPGDLPDPGEDLISCLPHTGRRTLSHCTTWKVQTCADFAANACCWSVAFCTTGTHTREGCLMATPSTPVSGLG